MTNLRLCLTLKAGSEIISTVEKLNRENGITIVLITHFMEEAQNADRVMVMDDGKIIADGAPKTVFGEIEALKNAGLDVPQTTELLYRLKKDGADICTDAISVEETADIISDALRSEGK